MQNMKISLDTLIAASPLLGHDLENRDCIKHAQDQGLARRLAEKTEVPLRSVSQRDLFFVAPLDILVSEVDGQKQFHLLELNGTGIGGITNLPEENVASILHSLEQSAETLDCRDGIVLLAISGRESESAPRLNRLMHEKLLFVDALRRGLHSRYGSCDVMNVEQIDASTDPLKQPIGRTRQPGPTVVMGYMKDLIRRITLEPNGELTMGGRPVRAAVNDRFCRNLLSHFGDRVDLTKFQTLNRTFAAGSDKGIAYHLMNEYVREYPHKALPDEVRYTHCNSRDSLISTVNQWLREGRKVVIKPHGTGLGHGIEFFLEPNEQADEVIQRIDASLALTEEYYGIEGGALPYTVCEFIDACKVSEPGHPFDGHKYELRVVVYRDSYGLKAFPSIAKIAREKCEDNVFVRRALINNITASGDTVKVSGTDYMLPLCNHRTLELLGLTEDELHDLCGAATGYVRHVLDQVEDQPDLFGLPVPKSAMEYVPLDRLEYAEGLRLRFA